MAKKWRSLPPEKYKRKAEEIQEHPLETLTQKQKHDIIMRMARRHQSDVYLLLSQIHHNYVNLIII